MANQPTIVAASLKDEDLISAIDKLVTHVDESTKKMAASMDSAVEQMKKKLGELGNVKIDFGGTSSGGGTKKVTNDQKTLEEQTRKTTDSLKEQNLTLDKQNELIKLSAISSRKEATLAFRNITTMDSSDLEKAQAKLDALVALKEKVKNTDLLSKQNRAELEKWHEYATALVEKFGSAKKSSSLDAINEQIKRNIQLEEQRRQATVQYGLEAQESYRKLLNILRKQAEESGGKTAIGKDAEKNIDYIAQLEEAIRSMRRAYYDMDSSQRESPLGKSLYEDIKTAQKLRNEVGKFNAQVAGIQRQTDSKLDVDKNVGSYERLSTLLKELTAQYRTMGREERNAESGADLAGKIQRTTRAIQQVQQQMNRPVNLDAALKGSEKTLDDIAYKMQRLQLYRQGIDLTKNGAANEIKQVDEALNKLQKDADKWMSKSKSMIEQNNALGRSWNYMKNRLAFYFTVGAGTQFVKNLIEVRSQYEMNERALGILIDSAERGTQIFNELSQMALVSPYTLIELSAAAKQLTAYDIAAKDVVDTTRRLADMAAAVGIPIERLTYALGQIKAYGYLNSRDARMFANAGIPLVKQLSEYYTELEGKLVSTADVYDRIKKKSIDYNEVMEVINKMTDRGGKFFDFQAKMADTLKVRLANLTLAWNNMLNEIGKSQQGVLTWGIGALKELFLQWKNINDTLSNVSWAVGVRTAVMLLFYLLLKLGNALGLTAKQMSLNAVFGARLAGVIRTLSSAMWSLVKNPLTWWSLLAVAAVEATQALLGANEAQKALNESIRNGAKDNYNNISKFLEQYKDIRESLYETRKVAIGNIYDPSSRKAAATAYSEESFAKDIDNNEAKKAWEAIREQIELTTASSDRYIQSLLSIKNMSERVRQGFNVLEDIRVVDAALKDLNDDTIKIQNEISGWWNLWILPDGLVGNLRDVSEAENKILSNYDRIEDARNIGSDWATKAVRDYERELKALQEDLKVTTDSIINFIELKGWSGDVNKINETFKQITQKLVLDNQLDPQKAFILQTVVEEARSEAAKKALLQRINDEKAALAQTADEESRKALVKSINDNVNDYNTWNEFNGRKKVEWERFTKWLKEQHISETTAMFRNMDAEDIKSLNFQEGKHAEWVNRMVTQYAKEHKMSYDEAFNYLKSWVNSANQWSVFIPLIISTGKKKSVYEQLGEYDKLVDEADAQIERLEKRVKELGEKEKLTKEETEELTNANKELTQAYKDKADAESHGGHGKKEKKDERAAAKAQKAAESELQKALKEELKLIDEVRSQYKKLTDAGVSRAVAMKTVTEQFGESIEHINAVLRKNGLPEFNIKTFAGTDNPHEMMVMLKKQIDAAKKVKNIKPEEINELEIKYSKIKVDAEAYDATKIKRGLDNELGRLKDEYELAVELDADPELGGIFADMFDIDLDTLPRTAKEYAEMYTKSLNRYFKEMGKDIELPNMLNLTRDDMAEFQRQMEDDKLEKVYFELIQKGYEATQEARKKETTDTIKEWNALMDKYGGLQNNLLRITKDTTKEIVGVIRKFGTDDEIRQALDLSDRISISQDPEEIARLQEQLRPIVDAVAKRNPIALNVITSSQRGEKEKSAKEYWEDFKNSELYSMTFENMANNSTIAIETILSKLEELKEKVKEDPASMKALMKSIQDARSELESRDPFKAMADGSVRLRKALTEQKTAFEELEAANRRVEGAKVAVRNAEATGSVEELEAANEKLNDALNEQDAANKKVVKSSNSVTAAREKIIKGLKGLSENLNQIKGLFDTVSQLFRDAGDDDTADAIDGISKGFTVMTTVIMGVVAAMELLKDSQAWLLAISAALAVVVGLTSWLNSRNNKKIDRQIKDSEISVKRLENAYKNLQVAVDNAYGAAKYGAQQAAIANKKLQLAELERQLELEKSRSSKNRDASKIEDLRGQIIDLRNEINKASEDIINDMLGISSVGSAAEELVSSMIEAFRNGEDYMAQYDESFEKMIDNMIMKAIVGKVIGDRLEEIWNSVNDIAKSRGEKSEKKINDITEYYEKELGDAQDNLDKWTRYLGYTGVDKDEARRNIEYYKKLIKSLESNYEKEMADAQREYTEAIRPQPEDINAVRDDVAAWRDGVKQDFEAYMDAFGIKFGENAEDKGLSSLQQGIQGVTEETASALEAMMNGVSQQVYLHTELLTQIRDAVINITGGDLETGIQAQMLFQLQQSYTVQMAIQNILENAVSPNGQSFRVELVS